MRCQLCGRFANHFYVLGEDDGRSTYADERCLSDAERRYYGLPAQQLEYQKGRHAY
jgi:hypothetical protein